MWWWTMLTCRLGARMKDQEKFWVHSIETVHAWIHGLVQSEVTNTLKGIFTRTSCSYVLPQPVPHISVIYVPLFSDLLHAPWKECAFFERAVLNKTS